MRFRDYSRSSLAYPRPPRADSHPGGSLCLTPMKRASPPHCHPTSHGPRESEPQRSGLGARGFPVSGRPLAADCSRALFCVPWVSKIQDTANSIQWRREEEREGREDFGASPPRPIPK